VITLQNRREPHLMGAMAEQYRAKARELEERSRTVEDATIREALYRAAQWQRELANRIEPFEDDGGKNDRKLS
jgi:hypothetical protein